MGSCSSCEAYDQVDAMKLFYSEIVEPFFKERTDGKVEAKELLQMVQKAVKSGRRPAAEVATMFLTSTSVHQGAQMLNAYNVFEELCRLCVLKREQSAICFIRSSWLHEQLAEARPQNAVMEEDWARAVGGCRDGRRGNEVTPLWQAADDGLAATAQLLLLGGGGGPGGVELTQQGRMTAPRLSSRRQHGADMNKLSSDMQAPINIAADRGHVAVVRVLLVTGADTAIKDKWGDDPLASARKYEPPRGCSALDAVRIFFASMSRCDVELIFAFVAPMFLKFRAETTGNLCTSFEAAKNLDSHVQRKASRSHDIEDTARTRRSNAHASCLSSVAALASNETLGGVDVAPCVVHCQLAPNQDCCSCPETMNFIVFEKRRMAGFRAD